MVATILMIFVRINCPNVNGLVWHRNTKFQIGIAATLPAVPLPVPLFVGSLFKDTFKLNFCKDPIRFSTDNNQIVETSTISQCWRILQNIPGSIFSSGWLLKFNPFFLIHRGATTAEKLRGPRFGFQHRGTCAPRRQRPSWVLGAWGGRTLPLWGCGGITPGKISENSNAKSCILV